MMRRFVPVFVILFLLALILSGCTTNATTTTITQITTTLIIQVQDLCTDVTTDYTHRVVVIHEDGLTLEANNSGYTSTKIFFEFHLPITGNWTITSNGYCQPKSVNITVQELGNTINIEIYNPYEGYCPLCRTTTTPAPRLVITTVCIVAAIAIRLKRK